MHRSFDRVVGEFDATVVMKRRQALAITRTPVAMSARRALLNDRAGDNIPSTIRALSSFEN